MRRNSHATPAPAGIALPAVLVIVSALLILAVGLISLVGIERRTARSYVDFQRAELAAKAGLEEVKAILDRETANDDFLVISNTLVETPPESTKEPVPYLFITRGSGGEEGVSYRHIPLFSTEEALDEDSGLRPPAIERLIEADPTEFESLPWYEEARVNWIPVKDERGRTVSRYAYWVEDLQSKVDARIAGNQAAGGGHGRSAWPSATFKPLDDNIPPLSVIAPYALDPEAGDEESNDLTRRLIDGRDFMLSPASILGATNFPAPQPRNEITGLLEDPLAAALERHASPVTQPYFEQPLVPYARGISSDAAGRPKLNLNRLLNASRSSAVNEFADWIDDALPEFERSRRGGFPEDYLKTLAANAFDYADPAGGPTVQPGSYRGVGSFPMLSEIYYKIDYLTAENRGGDLVLRWNVRLYAEFWNMTNRAVSGDARLSHELGMNPTPIGGGTRGLPFDSPVFLSDPLQSSHQLDLIGGTYYFPAQTVSLLPDEYKFYDFGVVSYSMVIGPYDVSANTTFQLIEEESEARGISFLWNGQQVDRIEKIVRDGFETNFRLNTARSIVKAAIPGHSYEPYGAHINNMGDPRIAHYIRELRLGENAVRNVSPNRRNVRRVTVYDDDGPTKPLHYGRVLPSEWPDGGHDSPVGNFPVFGTNDLAMAVPPTDGRYVFAGSSPQNAPHRVSEDGRFFSATELGHTYDPIMWTHAYPDIPGRPGRGDSDTLNAGRMPAGRNSWPDVSGASQPSIHYGGGNTLRIGRPEHERFNLPGIHAAHLLDLFHAGIPNSPARDQMESDLMKIEGHVNINTADRDTLRSLMVGQLLQDQEIREVTNWNHRTNNGQYSPLSSRITLGTPKRERAADILADAIVRSRPFASAAELAIVEDEEERPVFGNKDLYPEGPNLQWSDAAAEEVFARLYDSSTFRSRNFRVWVVGQSLAGTERNPQILSESRKVYTVFADPGERQSSGGIDPEVFKTRVLYENDF